MQLVDLPYGLPFNSCLAAYLQESQNVVIEWLEKSKLTDSCIRDGLHNLGNRHR